MQEPAHLYAKIMWNIALCPCGFEATTERPIQAASAVGRFMPGVEDARAENALERDSVGHWRASFDAATGRRGGGGRDSERRLAGCGVAVHFRSITILERAVADIIVV